MLFLYYIDFQTLNVIRFRKISNSAFLHFSGWLILIKFIYVVRMMSFPPAYGVSAEFWILVSSLSEAKIRFKQAQK